MRFNAWNIDMKDSWSNLSEVIWRKFLAFLMGLHVVNSNQPSLFLTFKCLGSGKLKQSLPRLVSELDKLFRVGAKRGHCSLHGKNIFSRGTFIFGFRSYHARTLRRQELSKIFFCFQKWPEDVSGILGAWWKTECSKTVILWEGFDFCGSFEKLFVLIDCILQNSIFDFSVQRGWEIQGPNWTQETDLVLPRSKWMELDFHIVTQKGTVMGIVWNC